MNIRDNVEVCGYCGGTITQHAEKPAGTRGRQNAAAGSAVQKTAKPARPPSDEEAPEGEEGEGGLSAILEPGEQVLIGSLNISVKKFSFHAYLTDRRIFLIDTQEKKLKVTAKDIPRDTIAGSIVEFSENSDPVLVLSIKSMDDEVKTMKLVFTQTGVDRSGEIDDWIGLLHEEGRPAKAKKGAPAKAVPEPEEAPEMAPEEEPEEVPEEEEPEEPVRPAKPVQRQELHPARKPVKDHERQPPVKRLLTTYRVPEPEPEPEPAEMPEPEKPVRRAQVRATEEPVRRTVKPVTVIREVPPAEKTTAPAIKKTDVHAAMKTAIKSPLQPVRHPGIAPVRKPVPEPVRVPEPEPVPEPEEEPESIIEFVPEKEPSPKRKVAHEESAEGPQFCHNCGKKLPHAANFCPGCGTKLNHPKGTAAPAPETPSAPAAHHTAASPAKKMPRVEVVGEEEEPEEAPRKPPVKKTPKGSDMTILHKFLRR